MSAIDSIKNKMRILENDLKQLQDEQNRNLEKSTKIQTERQNAVQKINDAFQRDMESLERKYKDTARRFENEQSQVSRKISDTQKNIQDLHHELEREMKKQVANDNEKAKRAA